MSNVMILAIVSIAYGMYLACMIISFDSMDFIIFPILTINLIYLILKFSKNNTPCE